MEEQPQNNKEAGKIGSWLRLLRVVGWGCLVCYFPIVFVFVKQDLAGQTCTRVVPHVHNDGRNVLITTNGLMNIIRQDVPDLVGTPIDDINFKQIEQTLLESSVVERCEAYPTVDGSVHVEIFQRKPIMRVFASDGSYYMDAEGYKVTAVKGMVSELVVVSGSVNKMLNTDALVSLCNYIYNDEFWHAMIEQIHVTKRQEFVLVPRVGDHIVEFGDVSRMEQKFHDLKTLYQKGWAKDEWNVYNKVCLKYNGQIVCTKK